EAFVPLHFDDKFTEATFVRWAKASGLRGRVIKGSELVPAVPPHDVRPDDKVEAALGGIEERREKEETFRAQVIEHAMGTGEYKFASATPLGKQRARYRVGDDTDRTAEIGELHLIRLLAGISAPEETGVEANESMGHKQATTWSFVEEFRRAG